MPEFEPSYWEKLIMASAPLEHEYAGKTAGSQPLVRRVLGEAPILVIGCALMAVCVSLLLANGINPGASGILANAQIFFMFVVVLT